MPIVAKAFRLYCTNAVGTYYRIGEIEVKAAPGGSDLCVGGTAFGNSDYYPASRAFNNSNASDGDAWVGNPGSSRTIGYEWATPLEIGEITIYNGMGAGEGQNAFDFEFQYSTDGTSWAPVFFVPSSERLVTGGLSYTYQIAAFTIAGVVHDDAGGPAAGRKVRVYRRDNGSLLKEVVTDAAGSYTATVGGAPIEVQRIVLDNDAGTLHNDLIDRVMPS